MNMNAEAVNALIAELQSQRNQALDRVAVLEGDKVALLIRLQEAELKHEGERKSD